MRLIYAMAALIICTSTAIAEPEYGAVRLDIDIGGSFFQSVWKNMGTKEGAVAVAAVCAAFGGDCTQQAFAGSKIVHDVYTKEIRNGHGYHGVWVPPDGMTICKAKVDWGHTGIDNNSTFNTTLHRGNGKYEDGLWYYVELGSNPGRGHGVNSTVYIQFVNKDEVNQWGCWPDETNTWLSKGPNNVTFYPGAHYP